jgi:hypothetical protein
MADYFKKFDPLVMGAKRPRLSVSQILAWADVYHAAKGRWPSYGSGVIQGTVFGTTWASVDQSLRLGQRGLPGGQSLARLLQEHRNVEPRCSAVGRRRSLKKRRGTKAARGRAGERTRLNVEQILAWADAHRAATGRWPSVGQGAVQGVAGETWPAIDHALCHGWRGLPRGSSLGRLLDEHRPEHRRTLSIDTIRAWARAHHAATGRWPRHNSGAVTGAPGETWCSIDNALKRGGRGLPSGLSLAKLFFGPGPGRPRKDKADRAREP